MFKITATEKKWLLKRRQVKAAAPKLDRILFQIFEKIYNFPDDDFSGFEDEIVNKFTSKIDTWLSKLGVSPETLLDTEGGISITFQLEDNPHTLTILFDTEDGIIHIHVESEEKTLKSFKCSFDKYDKTILSKALSLFGKVIKS